MHIRDTPDPPTNGGFAARARAKAAAGGPRLQVSSWQTGERGAAETNSTSAAAAARRARTWEKSVCVLDGRSFARDGRLSTARRAWEPAWSWRCAPNANPRCARQLKLALANQG